MSRFFRPLAFHVAVGAGLALASGATTASAQASAPPPATGTAPAPAPPATGTAPAPAPAPPPAAQPPGAYPYGRYPYGRYPYYYPGYRPPARRTAPRVLPYHEGQRIPPGYYLDESIYRGPAIAGAIVLGVPYVLSVAIASGFNFDNQSGWLMLPAIGPFITMAARHNSCSSGDYTCSDDATLRSLLVFDGLMQSTGAVLLIWGLSSHHKRLVREDARYLVIAPTRVGSGYGLGVLGRL